MNVIKMIIYAIFANIIFQIKKLSAKFVITVKQIIILMLNFVRNVMKNLEMNTLSL